MKRDQRIIQALDSAFEHARKEATLALKQYRMGRQSDAELYRQRTIIAATVINALKDQLMGICSENSIDWDEDEWQDIDKTITEASDLCYATYKYHPVDLGFDILKDHAVYIMRNSIGGLEQIESDPDPVGKEYSLILTLKNEAKDVNIEYSFKIIKSYPGEDQWIGFNCYEGFGRFSGYTDSSILYVKQHMGKCLSVAYMEVGIMPDDPVWKKRKKEIKEAKQWVSVEDYPPVWMGELRE